MSDTLWPRAGCGLALQVCDEVFWRYISLAEQACQCADLEFAVHRDDATFGALASDHMAAALANLLEAESLQCPERLGARDARQLRHALGC